MTARVNASGDTLARICELEAALEAAHLLGQELGARAEKAEARVAELEESYDREMFRADQNEAVIERARDLFGWPPDEEYGRLVRRDTPGCRVDGCPNQADYGMVCGNHIEARGREEC